MQNNPILAFFKISAFAILAFLVWISFWQQLRREDRTEELAKRIGQLQGDVASGQTRSRELADALNRLSGRVEALIDLLGSGAFTAPAAGGTAGPRPSSGGGTAGGAPAWLSDRAKALWGRHPDYLRPDPDPLRFPDLADAAVDANGRFTTWYGPTPSKINSVTASDARVTEYVEAYGMAAPAQRHALNPSLWSPDLAVRVEVTDDFREWTVFLRNDAWWHQPQVDLDRYPHLQGRHPVTARDFAFTLGLILNPDVEAAAVRSYYSECEGIEVVDDHCFVMRWRKPQYNAISFTLSLQPIPEFVFAYDESGRRYDEGQLGLAFNEHWFYKNNLWIGCGPYYVAEYDPSTHWLLRRFDDWYGERPAVREMYLEIFPDQRLQLQKLEGKEHDAGSIQVRDWEKKVVMEAGQNPFSDGRMGEHWLWRTSYSFIAWKNTHPIFRDPRVRKAMTMACDRFRIRDVLELGRAEICTGPQLPQTPFCPPDLAPIPFDLDAARTLLAEAGWTDQDDDGVLEKELDGEVRELRFTAMVPNNELFRPIFEIFKEDLSKIGVAMALEFLDWKQFAERLDSRTFECTALLWSGDGWESDLYQIWHSSQVEEVPSSNFIEFSDPVSDELIVRLRGTFDPDERIRLQRELHRRIAELQPYTFLLSYQLPFMYWKDRVGNVDEAAKFMTRPKLRFSGLSIFR